MDLICTHIQCLAEAASETSLALPTSRAAGEDVNHRLDCGPSARRGGKQFFISVAEMNEVTSYIYPEERKKKRECIDLPALSLSGTSDELWKRKEKENDLTWFDAFLKLYSSPKEQFWELLMYMANATYAVKQKCTALAFKSLSCCAIVWLIKHEGTIVQQPTNFFMRMLSYTHHSRRNIVGRQMLDNKTHYISIHSIHTGSIHFLLFLQGDRWKSSAQF